MAYKTVMSDQLNHLAMSTIKRIPMHTIMTIVTLQAHLLVFFWYFYA